MSDFLIRVIKKFQFDSNFLLMSHFSWLIYYYVSQEKWRESLIRLNLLEPLDSHCKPQTPPRESSACFNNSGQGSSSACSRNAKRMECWIRIRRIVCTSRPLQQEGKGVKRPFVPHARFCQIRSNIQDFPLERPFRTSERRPARQPQANTLLGHMVT